MMQIQKIPLIALRVSLGWVMFYAGITKILDPLWSAGPYLENAKTFSSFYHFLASPNILPTVNFLNEWGLTLIGTALIFGIFVKWASWFGAALMLLYYFPILVFPFPNPHSYLIDEHIVYALALIYLSAVRADRIINI